MIFFSCANRTFSCVLCGALAQNIFSLINRTSYEYSLRPNNNSAKQRRRQSIVGLLTWFYVNQSRNGFTMETDSLHCPRTMPRTWLPNFASYPKECKSSSAWSKLLSQQCWCLHQKFVCFCSTLCVSKFFLCAQLKCLLFSASLRSSDYLTLLHDDVRMQ